MKLFKIFVALFVGVSLLSSCGDDDDKKGNDVFNPSGPSGNDPKDDVDESYIPSASTIQTTWYGEYEGYDAEQSKNDGGAEVKTTIRRKLTLNPNGTYSNEIWGVLKKNGFNNTEFTQFEVEAGTYSYSATRGVVTYTVTYDSLINYKTLLKVGYDKKHYYSVDGKNSNDKKNYTEAAKFTKENKGRRQWITKDTYLHTLTDKLDNIDMWFLMDNVQK